MAESFRSILLPRPARRTALGGSIIRWTAARFRFQLFLICSNIAFAVGHREEVSIRPARGRLVVACPSDVAKRVIRKLRQVIMHESRKIFLRSVKRPGPSSDPHLKARSRWTWGSSAFFHAITSAHDAGDRWGGRPARSNV